MKSKLDNKFRHGTWYKGCGMTKREVLIKLHKNLDIYLDKKPALKQSDNLLDDIIYQDVLVGDVGFYRLSKEEYDFYISLDK